jgi:hypothetical protein
MPFHECPPRTAFKVFLELKGFFFIIKATVPYNGIGAFIPGILCQTFVMLSQSFGKIIRAANIGL